MKKFMKKALRRQSVSSSPSRMPSDTEVEETADPTLPVPPSPPPSPSRIRRRHLRFPLRSTRSFSDAKDTPDNDDIQSPNDNNNNNVNISNSHNSLQQQLSHDQQNIIHHDQQQHHLSPSSLQAHPVPQAQVFYDLNDDNTSNTNSLHRFPRDTSTHGEEEQEQEQEQEQQLEQELIVQNNHVEPHQHQHQHQHQQLHRNANDNGNVNDSDDDSDDDDDDDDSDSENAEVTRQTSFTRDYYDPRFPAHFSTLSASNLPASASAHSARPIRPRHNSFTPDSTTAHQYIPIEPGPGINYQYNAKPKHSKAQHYTNEQEPQKIAFDSPYHSMPPSIPISSVNIPENGDVQQRSNRKNSSLSSLKSNYQQQNNTKLQSNSFTYLERHNPNNQHYSNLQQNEFDSREYLANSASLSYQRNLSDNFIISSPPNDMNSMNFNPTVSGPRISSRRSKSSIKDPSISSRRRKQHQQQLQKLQHQQMLFHLQQQQQRSLVSPVSTQQLPQAPTPPLSRSTMATSLGTSTTTNSMPSNHESHKERLRGKTSGKQKIKSIESSPFSGRPALLFDEPNSPIEARLYSAYSDALHDEARNRTGGLRTIINLLRDCNGNVIIIEKASLAIAVLCENDSATRDVFGQYGAIQTLIQCLSIRIPLRFDKISTIEMIVYALCLLLKDSPKNMKLFEIFDGCKKLSKISSSQLYENHSIIPIHCLRSLCQLKFHPSNGYNANEYNNNNTQLFDSSTTPSNTNDTNNNSTNSSVTPLYNPAPIIVANNNNNHQNTKLRTRSSSMSSSTTTGTANTGSSPSISPRSSAIYISEYSSSTTKTIKYIIRCMSIHEHRMEIQELGLDAIRTMINRRESGIKISGNILKRCIISSSIAFKMHKESNEIQWQCLSLMCDIEDLKESISANMTAVPTNNTNNNNNYMNDTNNIKLDVATFFSALKLIVDNLKLQPTNVNENNRIKKSLTELIKRGINIAVKNSWKHIDFKTLAVEAGGVETMLEILNLFENNIQIVDKVCTILRVLFQSQEGQYRMNNVGSACALLAAIAGVSGTASNNANAAPSSGNTDNDASLDNVNTNNNNHPPVGSTVT